MNPTFYGKIGDGKLRLFDRDSYEMWLGSLDGKDVAVSVREAKPINNRTNSQNAYLWGVVYKLISEHTGFTPEEVHEAMKYRFLKKEFIREKVEWPAKLKSLWNDGVLRTMDSFLSFVKSAILEENKVIYTFGSTRILTTLEFEDYVEKVRTFAREVLDLIIPLPNEVNG